MSKYGIKSFFAIFATCCLMLTSACGDDSDESAGLCDEADCGDNMHCDEANGEYVCDDGYTLKGDICKKDVEGEACNDEDCPANSHCDEESDECACDEGFEAEGDKCVAEEPQSCLDTGCGDNAICDEESGECFCTVGFVESEDGQCLAEEALADFDDFTLDEKSFYNGAPDGGEIVSGNLIFNNSYNSEYDSWAGFAYSNMTDLDTHDWTNQYSAMSAGEANGSIFGVSYVDAFASEPPTISVDTDQTGGAVTIEGAWITNTVYTYFTMFEGNDYAKKFGGEDEQDADWLLLTVTGMDASGEATGSLEFYLADFRSDNDEEDYIINDWTWVDFSSLGPVESVNFAITSSDVGEYGINTPTYFAIDQITAQGN